MAQRTSQGVMDGGSALPSGTAQPALPLAEALGRRNPDQRAPSPALAKKEALYATRPKPPAQLIRATRSFAASSLFGAGKAVLRSLIAPQVSRGFCPLPA